MVSWQLIQTRPKTWLISSKMENLQPKLEAAWVEVKALAKLGANLFNEACAGREAWEVCCTLLC
jgi:hypothetical protein